MFSPCAQNIAVLLSYGLPSSLSWFLVGTWILLLGIHAKPQFMCVSEQVNYSL